MKKLNKNKIMVENNFKSKIQNNLLPGGKIPAPLLKNIGPLLQCCFEQSEYCAVSLKLQPMRVPPFQFPFSTPHGDILSLALR